MLDRSPIRRPHRVQLRRTKGWRMPANTVKVDRTTKWGNPFVIGRDGDRAQCVARFRYEVAPKLASDARRELRGHNLACWCAPGPCHADALIEIANSSRAAFEKWRFRLCRDCGADVHKIGHYCMVRDELWATTGLISLGGLLCLACLEGRIGRPLHYEDFTAIVPSAWSEYVRARREPVQLTLQFG
jgi:hypothetical protein